MKTAVIYARYSSERQTEQSIEGQLRVCNDYARRNDILILDTYIDRAMTGTNDNRSGFQQMMKDCSRQTWDMVLVYKLDRFSRNKYEIAMHKKTLRDNGIKLVSAMENIPNTPEGIILESLLEGMAEYYSAELSQKVKRGLNESRQKGNFTGGYILLGYKVVDKKVVVDEENAEIVRYIFSQYANGIFVDDIIADLANKGITNRGKPFAFSSVYSMLRNEKYIGIYRYGGEVFSNIYPQIIPTAVFDIIGRKLNNKHGRRGTENLYLLTGKLLCGKCGSHVSVEAGTSKTGRVFHYYQCAGKKRQHICTKRAVRKDLLEPVIVDATTQILSKTNFISFVSERVYAAYEQRVKLCSVLEILQREQKEIEKSISNLLTAIEKGIISDSTQARLNELENKKKLIEEKTLIEKGKLSVKINREDIEKYVKNILQREPQLLIDFLVDHIILFDDRAEIYYKYI